MIDLFYFHFISHFYFYFIYFLFLDLGLGIVWYHTCHMSQSQKDIKDSGTMMLYYTLTVCSIHISLR